MSKTCQACTGDYDLPATIKCTECNMSVCSVCYGYCDCAKDAEIPYNSDMELSDFEQLP